MKSTFTCGASVVIVRRNLSSLLARELPSSIFFTPGTVRKVDGARVGVEWTGIPRLLWFDEDALLEEPKPAAAK